MRIVSGVDLVYLPRFKKALKSGGENFLRRVFAEQELDHEVNHLVGIFAAKEAVIKALSIPSDSWHDIRITHNSDGAPKVLILHPPIPLISHSLSISYAGTYVIAQFVAILK